jgi:hypothetical protein
VTNGTWLRWPIGTPGRDTSATHTTVTFTNPLPWQATRRRREPRRLTRMRKQLTR